jgi:hypothetical protein
VVADLVDDRGRVVFLLLVRKPIIALQVKVALVLGALALLLARLGYRRNQFGLSPSLAWCLVERLPLAIERVVALWLFIG